MALEGLGGHRGRQRDVVLGSTRQGDGIGAMAGRRDGIILEMEKATEDGEFKDI